MEFTGAVLFQSLLIQDDHIPAGNAQYAFFLHGRNHDRAEALGRQGPRTKSAFIRFGNVAIFNKWLWMDA
jgi:hypothetical protein